jgi:hypothetical protein
MAFTLRHAARAWPVFLGKWWNPFANFYMGSIFVCTALRCCAEIFEICAEIFEICAEIFEIFAEFFVICAEIR